MELQEQFPTITEIQNLEHMGFSREQIANLFSVRALYRRGAYYEITAEHRRLEFIRWLYLKNQLQS